MPRILKKVSSLLQRGHMAIDRRIARKEGIRPRIIRYNPNSSLSRIVHFNGNFVIGGTSQLIADIIERSSDKYYHQVIIPQMPDPLPYQPLPVRAYSISAMTDLYETLQHERPTLAHIHYWVRPMHRYFDFGLWYDSVFRICEELQIPVIQNVDVPTTPHKSKSIRHNVFVSHYVLNEFNDSDTPSSVIYPGSDLEHFSSNNNEPLPATVGMVYRLDRDKLNEQVIDIFISAVRKKPDLQCYIIGGGFYLGSFKQAVKEARLEKNIVFTGFVSYDDLPGWYKKIGLIVAPVHDESFGQVTPFAMGMGLPVVGYDTGAMSELLGGKENLVATGNTERLAQLIVDTVTDHEKRKQLGAANKKRALDLFSVETMIREYDKLYQSLL
jgi:glycosyltransferase involved in cell wall biosynthesis